MINIDALKKNLESLDETSLNEILDQRDGGAFDQAWVSTEAAVPDGENHPDDNEIFIQLSKITNQHEICSYISDDLNLLHKASISAIESPFLNYMKQCYEQGRVPKEWDS